MVSASAGSFWRGCCATPRRARGIWLTRSRLLRPRRTKWCPRPPKATTDNWEAGHESLAVPTPLRDWRHHDLDAAACARTAPAGYTVRLLVLPGDFATRRIRVGRRLAGRSRR